MGLIRPSRRSWKKSSYSAADGNCVEVGLAADDYVSVRDSKNKSMPALDFKAADWRTFIEEVKRNRLGRTSLS